MTLGTRLARLAAAVRARPPAGQFSVVRAVPVAAAAGRPPGLYADGPPGSTAGLLVYDPAAGGPQVPAGRLAPWGLLVVCEAASVDAP